MPRYDFRSPRLFLEHPLSAGIVSGDTVVQGHVVVVRAYDRYDNMNSAKTIVPTK